jgi:hypothetical protein
VGRARPPPLGVAGDPISGPREVVSMGWLDLVGIIVLCTIVFMLVSICERERHGDKR